MKKEAIQLGYLCCVHLKNPQQQRIFEHHLSEIGLDVPVLEQTAKEVWIFVMCALNLPCDMLTIVAFYDAVPAMW